MTVPNKNNPDGHGSYGTSPSRFKERPKEKANERSNDATEGPLGHVGPEQEVFDREQQKETGNRVTKSKSPKADPPPHKAS